MDAISSRSFVFFTNNDNVETLNRVLRYIERNEPTKNLKIVAVVKDGKHVAKNLQADIEAINRAYPNINVQFVEEQGEFGPKKIDELSKRWGIPINFMFIGAPGDDFPFKIQQLGEVRVIV